MNALLSFTAILILITSVRLWVRAYGRLRLGQPILTPEPRVDAPWGLADLILAIFFQLLTAQLLAEWLRSENDGNPLKSLEDLPPAEQASILLHAALAQLAAWALTLAWLVVRYRPTLRELGLDWRRLGDDMRLGVAGFVMLAPIVYALQAFLVQFVKSEHPLIEVLKEESSVEFFVISGFSAVLVAPLVEESIFRLWLQGWLERIASKVDDARAIVLGGRVPSPVTMPVSDQPGSNEAEPANETVVYDRAFRIRGRMAIFGSSALFALAHFRHGPDPIPLFVLALGLGYLYQTTQRILPCIIVHLLLNGSTLAMLWLSIRHGPPAVP